MRRALLITLLLSIPTILILVLIAIEESKPPPWQVELDKYMVYKGAVVSDTLKMKLVDNGAMPWHFNRIMSRATFGESSYFKMDYGFDGKRVNGGSVALPYPPESLWCALLEADSQPEAVPSGKSPYIVVIIAQHEDLQDRVTAVHEISSDHIPLVQSLGIVGCSRVMEEVQFEEAGIWT